MSTTVVAIMVQAICYIVGRGAQPHIEKGGGFGFGLSMLYCMQRRANLYSCGYLLWSWVHRLRAKSLCVKYLHLCAQN